MSARAESTSPAKPFDAFMEVFPGLAFVITVVNPRAARSWSAPDGKDSADKGLRRTIYGVGKLGEESIVVIGSDVKAAKYVEVTIYGFDSAEDLADDWNHAKASSADAIRLTEEEVRKGKGTGDHEHILQDLRKAYEEFDKRPPTATIQHEKTDWEIRQREHWEVRCAVPSSVIDAIGNDMDAGRCERISLFVAPRTAWRLHDRFPGEATIYGVYSYGSLGGYARGGSTASVGARCLTT